MKLGIYTAIFIFSQARQTDHLPTHLLAKNSTAFLPSPIATVNLTASLYISIDGLQLFLARIRPNYINRNFLPSGQVSLYP